MISPLLLNSFGSWAIGLMMGCLALVSVTCLLHLDEHGELAPDSEQ